MVLIHGRSRHSQIGQDLSRLVGIVDFVEAGVADEFAADNGHREAFKVMFANSHCWVSRWARPLVHIPFNAMEVMFLVLRKTGGAGGPGLGRPGDGSHV